MSETGTPSAGQIARLSQRGYLVERVTQPPNVGDSPLVELSRVDDDAQGQPLQVLWDREIDREILTGEAWDAIAQRGFDPPKLFSAYFNTLKWNCVTATDPKLFQSPFRAGIRLDAYQLEPLRKALRLPRVNLFIADDVGLGKTIEAGLIARELLLRKKAREIVVCCPPSMLYQWKDELETRFGLTFEILDKDYMKRVRQDRGFGVNPWSTHSRFLVSHRLLIDEVYAGPFRDWLGDFKSGSLFILDEAHHAAPSSGQKYAIDSHITRAVRDLAPRFEHRLFLSATPHNGHSNSFSALLELLDPQRFCRGVPVKQKMLDDVMVRRLKDDIRAVGAGVFPKRHVVQVDIDGLPADAPELRLSELLDQYRQLREQRLSGETKRNRAAAGLLITGLQQRLLSSIEAFARTLAVHRRTVQRQQAQSRPEAGALACPRRRLSEALRAPPVRAPAALDANDDMPRDPEAFAHQEWLGYVQPAGLVVSIPALLATQAHVNRNIDPDHQRFLACLPRDKDDSVLPEIRDFPKITRDVFNWREADLEPTPPGEERYAALEVTLPEYHETLRPTHVVRDPEPKDANHPWMMLIQEHPAGTDLDAVATADARHWQAPPQAKFERLLREARVPLGLLVNGRQIRMVYAPRGETSGHMTFGVADMAQVAGRPIFAALHMLLCDERLFSLGEKQRLPAILADSRKYQNVVSTQLAEQVLAALYELVRGFQAADDQDHGELLRGVLAEDPTTSTAGCSPS